MRRFKRLVAVVVCGLLTAAAGQGVAEMWAREVFGLDV